MFFRMRSGTINQIPMAPEIIDGFEDGDLDEYFGDTAVFAASQTNPFEGDHSLEATTTSSGARNIFRTDVSWGPSDDSTLQCWITRKHSVALLFGVQSDTAYYYAQLSGSGTNDTRIRIAKQESGFTGLNQADLGIDRTLYDWLRVVVDWQTDGSITVTVYDQSSMPLGSVSVTDTTYGAGGVGVDIYASGSTETTTYLDTIETVAYAQSDVATHTALDGEFDTRTELTGEFSVRTTLVGTTQ